MHYSLILVTSKYPNEDRIEKAMAPLELGYSCKKGAETIACV